MPSANAASAQAQVSASRRAYLRMKNQSISATTRQGMYHFSTPVTSFRYMPGKAEIPPLSAACAAVGIVRKNQGMISLKNRFRKNPGMVVPESLNT